MRIDRRRALAVLGLGAAAPGGAQAQHGAVSFRHGVASGDPLQDRVVIWTRITPAKPGGEIAYRWRLGERSGDGVTGPARDYTVKVDVAGLRPGTEYAFGFEAEGVASPEGRTRTLPAGPTQDVVLAVASCALYPYGYFNAYQAIADLPRVDAVLHLGDYIYEYGGAGSYGMDSPIAAERPHDPPHEVVTLADYRRRHAQYKSDPALQAAHARAPWIVAWDDHETANDSFSTGAENHQPDVEGDWNARKAAALRAYVEWMPIREPAAGQSMAAAASRSFHFGDLASLIMLETRLRARDRQLTYEADLPMVDGKPDLPRFRAKLDDPGRRMLGAAQEAWIAAELARSVQAGHAWQVLGNQVVMGRILLPDLRTALDAEQMAGLDEAVRTAIERLARLGGLGLPFGLDMWDGYPADRERLYELVRLAGARPVVVSGDSHAFWANELADAAGRRVACEFGTTGITSPGAGDYLKGLDVAAMFAQASPEVVFNDQSAKGFVLLTLAPGEARADMVAVSTITGREFTATTVKSFRVTPDGSGVSRLAEA